MKGKSLLLWLLVGLPLSVAAQPSLSIGPILNPFSTYAGESLDFDAPYRYSTGVNVGLQAQIHFNPKWSLATGVWYETATVKSGDGLYSAGYRTRQQAVAIPLVVNYRPMNRIVSPYLSAGLLLNAVKGQQGMTARPLLAAGLSYRVAERLTLNVQPSLTLGASTKGDRLHYPANRQLSLQTQLMYIIGSKEKR